VPFRLGSPRQRSPARTSAIASPDAGAARASRLRAADERRRKLTVVVRRHVEAEASLAVAVAPVPAPTARVPVNRRISAHATQSQPAGSGVPAWYDLQDPCLFEKKNNNGALMYNLVLTAPHQLPLFTTISDPDKIQYTRNPQRARPFITQAERAAYDAFFKKAASCFKVGEKHFFLLSFTVEVFFPFFLKPLPVFCRYLALILVLLSINAVQCMLCSS
jgi:hypothetical protein